MKNPKNVTTDDKSINEAESKLDIIYPKEIRELLKVHNGFCLGGFEFYRVLDNEDLEHTFDDVVRENTNSSAGWKNFLPEGFVSIADDGGQGCLVLNINKDGVISYWNNDAQEMTTYSVNGIDFVVKLRESELELSKL